VRSLITFVVLVAGAAAIGGLSMPGAWYAGLSKPGWTPPNRVFGPVWTILYLGIAVAGWLVWRSPGGAGRPAPGVWPALIAWGGQLLLNGLWSWLFFGLRQPAWALVDIVLLLTAILTFIVLARPLSAVAAGLFAPYAAWVAYATALNAAIWWMNRSGAG